MQQTEPIRYDVRKTVGETGTQASEATEEEHWWVICANPLVRAFVVTA